MAINVNKVYKKVLSIINKEQRGFITPDEFNKYATNAQLQLLDIAFSDFTSVSNLDTAMRTNMGYADMPSKIKEKIDQFYKTSSISLSTGVGSLPTDVYKIIEVSNSSLTLPYELIDKHEMPYLLSSPLTAPSADYPMYYKGVTTAGATQIHVNPTTISSATLQYVKVPSDPRFGYTVNATYGTNTYDTHVYVDGGLIIDEQLTIPTVTANNAGVTGALATTTNGSGSGATLKLTATGGNITIAQVVASGSGYAVGDQITVTDAVMEADTNIGLTGGDLVITIGSNDLYNTTTRGSTDFELHPSEEPTLTTSILMLAGISMKDREIVSLSGQAIQANAVAKKL